MSEEPRFFVRIALYGVIAGTIYWFVSYEDAGTALFVFLVGGCLFFAATAATIIRAGRAQLPEGRGLVGKVQRALGFVDQPDGTSKGPLEVEPEAIPPASSWPLMAASSLLLIGLGLLYGAWFWLPGLGLAAAAAWGWTTELTR